MCITNNYFMYICGTHTLKTEFVIHFFMNISFRMVHVTLVEDISIKQHQNLFYHESNDKL